MGVKLTKDIVNERLSADGRGIIMSGDYVNARTKTEFICSHGHTWKINPCNVLRGDNCPHCYNEKRSLTKEVVSERLISDGRGIVMTGEYIDAVTKTEFQCIENHKWHTRLCDILFQSQGCPYCSTRGFQRTKPAWLYVLAFGTYIKYGITNNLNNRLAQHKRNGEYTIELTKFFQVGSDAINLERTIKQKFGGRFVSDATFQNGHTETLCISKLNEVIKVLN
jgi:hypothetical protein